MATFQDQDRHPAPVIYDGHFPDTLGDDRFDGWVSRPSAGALLMALGVGVLAGIILGVYVARLIAGWIT